jgi:hypothetical protein
LFLILQALTLLRARIAEKVAEVQQHSHIAELEEANAQLCTELTTGNAKDERRERARKSDYSSLHSDFSDLQTVHIALEKEK